MTNPLLAQRHDSTTWHSGINVIDDAAGVYDGVVHTFDMSGSKPKERTQLSGHKSPARAVQFTPDSRTLAAGAGE